jgi:hypothetical protein
MSITMYHENRKSTGATLILSKPARLGALIRGERGIAQH